LKKLIQLELSLAIRIRNWIGRIRRKILESEPEVCIDLAAWAQTDGAPLVPLAEPLFPTFDKLFQDFPLGREMIDFHREELSRHQVLVTIQGATIRDRVGLVQLPDGDIVFDGNWWMPALKQDPSYRRRFCARTRKISGNMYSLLARWASGYYHWFHDVLPRLEACLPLLPHDCQFLIEECPPQWQIESLKAFGIHEGRLIEQPDRCDTRPEVLWFATPAGQTALGSIALIKKVVRRLKLHFKIESAPPTRKIYLSRQRSRRRRLLNEDEVTKILDQLGFEKFFAEELTLQQQIELFSMARMVVSAHGAGLTNMIFCPPGAFIGEINFEDSVYRSHYFVLARQMGFDRVLIGANRANELEGGEYDLIVKLNELIQLEKLNQ
jgi:hypothetical protein